jgi:hypothetical protein
LKEKKKEKEKRKKTMKVERVEERPKEFLMVGCLEMMMMMKKKKKKGRGGFDNGWMDGWFLELLVVSMEWFLGLDGFWFFFFSWVDLLTPSHFEVFDPEKRGSKSMVFLFLFG